MGKRGPAKQPTILRYIRGNPSKEGFNSREPVPPPADETPPESLDGIALQKWRETVPKLKAMGVFTEADRGTWERYCIEYELWRMAREKVRKFGDVMTFKPKADGEVPYMQVSPFASQMMRYATSLLRIEMQFGLTPSSRSQVQIHGSADDDPLEAFITKRGS
jgi:P27 family predicted phage terminase small subunit